MTATWPAHEFGGQRRQSIVAAICPAVFDRDVLAFDVAGFVRDPYGMPARLAAMPVADPAVEKPNHRHRRLLRARGERPRRRRAAESVDELAPLHGPPRRSMGFIINEI